VQARGPNVAYVGVWQSLSKMWREEGMKGMMRGNGVIECIVLTSSDHILIT